MSETENVKMTEAPVEIVTLRTTTTTASKLVDVPVIENTALNVMVQF